MSQVVQGVVRGVIHGKTIELLSDPGLMDGQLVQVTIHTEANLSAREEALRSAAGALAHLPQEAWDELDAIVRDRHKRSIREVPE